MRIFVSSSYEDLREYRSASIHILRQLGHEVLAMEEMVAGPDAPLIKVLEMIDRSEAYVGIFAWRYGYIPVKDKKTKIPKVKDAVEGETSITHYEYLRAVERKLPVMAFLLDENYPWPPRFIDGFDKTSILKAPNDDKIRSLRQSLQQERVVSWFRTASDLEARVAAAVTMAGLTSQIDLETTTALPSYIGAPGDTSNEQGIKDAIIFAGNNQQQALKIDLHTTWWSTRLYMIATLANRLTKARRIIIVDTRPKTRMDANAKPGNTGQSQMPERFIGQLSTTTIVATIGSKIRALKRFERWLNKRQIEYSDINVEINEIINAWYEVFADSLGNHHNEEAAKVDLTAELLRRWFGDSMLKEPLRISDLRRASAVDLIRLLDYPNDYVPVLTRFNPETDGQEDLERVDLVDKNALNSRLARNYLVELLDRARIL